MTSSSTGGRTQRPAGVRLKGCWPKWRRRNPPCHAALAALEIAVEVFGAIRPVARILNVDQHTVGKWLSGRHWPSVENARRILEEFR